VGFRSFTRKQRRLHQRLVLYTLHLITSAAAVSIPTPRIVLRLRAPSSCPDLFAESLDDRGARRRETIDRYLSFDLSRENDHHYLLPTQEGGWFMVLLDLQLEFPSIFSKISQHGI
jgi:hypothetical protein